MRVNIVTERSAWILRRTAKALAARLPYVRINAWWGRFDIVFFMPYYRFRPVPGSRTMALFTHREDGDARLERAWDECAAAVDCCVPVSPRSSAQTTIILPSGPTASSG